MTHQILDNAEAIAAARAEWERILDSDPRTEYDYIVGWAEAAADGQAPRGSAHWYAAAGSWLQDYLHPYDELVLRARIDQVRRREHVRSGETGWVAVLEAMRAWVVDYDRTYQPSAREWAEPDVTRFVEVSYPGGVGEFVEAFVTGRVRRPLEVDEILRKKTEYGALFQARLLPAGARSGWMTRWLDIAADPDQPSEVRAMASRIVLGTSVPAHGTTEPNP